jgi:hypothetical protein
MVHHNGKLSWVSLKMKSLVRFWGEEDGVDMFEKGIDKNVKKNLAFVFGP